MSLKVTALHIQSNNNQISSRILNKYTDQIWQSFYFCLSYLRINHFDLNVTIILYVLFVEYFFSRHQTGRQAIFTKSLFVVSETSQHFVCETSWHFVCETSQYFFVKPVNRSQHFFLLKPVNSLLLTLIIHNKTQTYLHHYMIQRKIKR